MDSLQANFLLTMSAPTNNTMEKNRGITAVLKLCPVGSATITIPKNPTSVTTNRFLVMRSPRKKFARNNRISGLENSMMEAMGNVAR